MMIENENHLNMFSTQKYDKRSPDGQNVFDKSILNIMQNHLLNVLKL